MNILTNIPGEKAAYKFLKYKQHSEKTNGIIEQRSQTGKKKKKGNPDLFLNPNEPTKNSGNCKNQNLTQKI